MTTRFCALLFTLFIFCTQAHAQAWDCFGKHALRDVQLVDSKTLKVLTNAYDYLVTVPGCTELPNAKLVDFETYPVQSFDVCPDDDLVILDPVTQVLIQRCRISDIQETF